MTNKYTKLYVAHEKKIEKLNSKFIDKLKNLVKFQEQAADYIDKIIGKLNLSKKECVDNIEALNKAIQTIENKEGK